MRNLAILLVLVLTAGTFYSALWYKSENIEQDITARVTDQLSDADNIAIDVDGRHVTLSGIVYDEATETAYLQTANDTYGALGPIDGLTYQPDGGYVKVVKTADGIALHGTVPSEDLRATLLASAQAATNGSVDDQLSIAGPVAGWQDEAVFGVDQLAGLSAGTLTAAAGVYALSGTTDGDPATLTSALADREGWNTYISSPMAQDNLSADVARLTGDLTARDTQLGELTAVLADRDSTIIEQTANVATLEAELAASEAQVDMLVVERDTISTELDNLRASLSDGQSNNDALGAELATSQSNLDAARAALVQKDDQIADLQSELANRQNALGSTDAQVVTLQGALDRANQSIEDLNGQVSERDATIAALQATSSANAATESDQIAALNDAIAQRDDRIETLTARNANTDAEVGRLTADLADRDVALAATAAQIAALQSEVDTRETVATTLNGQLNTALATIAARDQTIEALGNQAPAATQVEQCADQAGAVMEGSRINFATGTATIDADSVALLERVTGIALACVGEGLTVEVGGHTDSQGTDENNQALSEARAQAVVAFMAERGVPANGLVAVGYGEANPIASNDTAAGRAQNRRISFDWQAR